MSCVVACIALGVVMFRGGLCPLLYTLGGRGYIESSNRVLLESNYNRMGSFFVLRLVLRHSGSYKTDKIHPYAISYSRIFYVRDQSRYPGSDT